MTDRLRAAAQAALEALELIRDADTSGATPKQVVAARKTYEDDDGLQRTGWIPLVPMMEKP